MGKTGAVAVGGSPTCGAACRFPVRPELRRQLPESRIRSSRRRRLQQRNWHADKKRTRIMACSRQGGSNEGGTHEAQGSGRGGRPALGASLGHGHRADHGPGRRGDGAGLQRQDHHHRRHLVHGQLLRRPGRRPRATSSRSTRPTICTGSSSSSPATSTTTTIRPPPCPVCASWSTRIRCSPSSPTSRPSQPRHLPDVTEDPVRGRWVRLQLLLHQGDHQSVGLLGRRLSGAPEPAGHAQHVRPVSTPT